MSDTTNIFLAEVRRSAVRLPSRQKWIKADLRLDLLSVLSSPQVALGRAMSEFVS